ncbi:MAG: hypothetical protein ACUVWP_05705 [bacterium]
MNVNKITIFFIIFFIFAIVLVSQIYFRPVDRDEGFWIGSAQLINNDYRLYEDFPLPHTTLVCVIYSTIFKIFRTSIIAGRYFNVLITLISFTLIYYITRNENMPNKTIPLIIFAFSYLSINWLIPVKVYSITLFLTVLSFTFLSLTLKNNQTKWILFLTGILFGLIVSSRIILIPLLFIPLFFLRKVSGPIKWFFLYIVGVIIGVLPIIYYTFKCPGQFYFNIIGIHTLALSGYKSQLIRLNLFKELLFDPGSIIIFLIMIFSIYRVLSKKRDKTETMSSIFLIIIILVNIVPISTSLQYFTLTVPFVSISASYINLHKTRIFKNFFHIFIAIYIVIGLLKPAYRVLHDYYHKPLVGISEVVSVEKYIYSIVDENDVVGTWWGGYVTKGVPHPNLILGEFSERIEKLLQKDERRLYHLPSYDEQIEIILKNKPHYIILGIDTPEGIENLIRERYILVKTIGETKIYAINY